VLVGVPDVRAFAAHNEQRFGSDGTKCAHRRVHASRNHASRPLLQAARLLGFPRCDGRHRSSRLVKASPATGETAKVRQIMKTQATTIAAPRSANSPEIHGPAITLQHPRGTVEPSSCPSNREGLRDSLGGSGLSFLILSVARCSLRLRSGQALPACFD